MREDELNFQKGDEILEVEKIDSDWCRGLINGKTGIFPASYVEIMKNL
jgi:hypothetical protein